MIDSATSGDLMGGNLGRLALAISVLAAVLLALPFALTSVGFGALIGVAGGLQPASTSSFTDQRAPRTDGSLGAVMPQPVGVAANSIVPHATDLLREARSWLGIRYLFGGCSPSGIDCSCFIQTIFRAVGIALPRTSQQQFEATVGRGFGAGTPEPGDIVFFFRTYSDPGQDWTHVGLVSRVDSNGIVWMIDAPGARAAGDPPDAPFGRVREEPIAGSWLQHRPAYAQVR